MSSYCTTSSCIDYFLTIPKYSYKQSKLLLGNADTKKITINNSFTGFVSGLEVSGPGTERPNYAGSQMFVTTKGSSSKALFNFAPRELLSITQAKFLYKRLFRVLLKSFPKTW